MESMLDDFQTLSGPEKGIPVAEECVELQFFFGRTSSVGLESLFAGVLRLRS